MGDATTTLTDAAIFHVYLTTEEIDLDHIAEAKGHTIAR